MSDEKRPTLADIVRETVKELSDKGGKTVANNEEYLSKKDFEHMKALEAAQVEAQKYKAEFEKAVTGYQEAIDPDHSQHCRGGNCEITQAHQQIKKWGYDEGYEKGKADAKKNLTPDDLNVNLVGEYLRKIQAIGVGKGKGDAEYRVIKGIKVGGK